MSTMTLINAKGAGDFLRLRFWGAVLLMLGALLALGAGSAHAAPLAGTSIGNQASASYRDNNNVDRITVSNSVSTIVQAVGSANMVQNNSKIGAPGQTLEFAHTIYNTGNSPDTFTVTIGAQVNSVGNAFTVATTGGAIFADANCDGQADNATKITTVGPVAAGGFICFVTQAALSTTTGDSSNFPVGYSSSFAGAVLSANGVANTFINTDTATIATNAVINVTKSISVSTGPSGTVVTYQLTYRNTGTVSAGNVVIADIMPSGATYVAGSGRWSGSTSTPLTEASTSFDAGVAGVAPYRIDYGTSGTTVVAILERVDPGASGVVQFNATMAGAGNTRIDNFANWCYNSNGTTAVTQTPAVVSADCAAVQGTIGAGDLGTVTANIANLVGATNTAKSNIVPFFIPQIGANGVARITDNPANTDGTNPTSTALSTAIQPGNAAGDDVIVVTTGQGTLATWDAYVFNAGSGTDTFNITMTGASNFPVGTTFLLFRSDTVTPLTDSNNDGVLDTGPIAAGSNYQVRVVAVMPPGGAAGVYDAIVQAQSTNTTTSTNTVAVRAYIVGSRVDLRNTGGTGAGYGGAAGFGEAAPVTTVATNPNTVATFGLIVVNTGNVADSYDLAYNLASGNYNTTAPFAFVTPLQVAGGYQVQFFIDSGTTCSAAQLSASVNNSGVIAPSASRNVCVQVTVPVGATAGNLDFYFRALSPTTFTGGAGSPNSSSGDVKFDRLTINIFRVISIRPNNSGQIFPGGSIQYCHTITNGGNVTETLSVAQSDQSLFTAGAAGWAQYATVYIDTDSNCSLNGTENTAPLTATVLAGANQTFTAGQSRNIIVVVQAPGAAVAGQVNVNTFTLSAVSGATGSLVATDTTAVVIGQVQLVKDQFVDTTCAQTFTGASLDALAATNVFVQSQLTARGSIGATLGLCIIYRVRATNAGTLPVSNLTMNDVAPPNTTLHAGAVSAVANPCTPGGGSPNVSCAHIAQPTGNAQVPNGLAAGATATMYFRVRID